MRKKVNIFGAYVKSRILLRLNLFSIFPSL